VPFPVGGIADLYTRIIGARVAESWGQPVLVENRTGAGGNIGADLVAKSPPDGYTLGIGSVGTHAVNVTLFGKLPYDPVADFAPIALVAEADALLVVHPSVSARSVAELIALARARPGALSFASAGPGTTSHLAGELFKSMAGIDMVHIPFSGGGPALAALLGGQIDVLFETSLTVQAYAKAGKLRILAVGSEQRVRGMPDVPTLSESGFPGFSAENWYGIYAPAGTPHEIVMKLNHEIVKALSLPDVKERFASQGADLVGNTPEQHTAFLKAEMGKWKGIVRISHATVD
jgi:tripartite-type tricarboxylate transporter receptor subunit TctC